jgi:hypothetical protein
MHEGGTGLGAGRVIGPFLQLFETLPQPLPELRGGATASMYSFSLSAPEDVFAQCLQAAGFEMKSTLLPDEPVLFPFISL